MDSTGHPTTEAYSPIRSGANILVSTDGGTSYTYAESYLGSYIKSLSSNSLPSDANISYFALTGLDSFHVSSIGGSPTSIGPATFYDNTKSFKNLNAVVSQFNDIKWFANPDPTDTDYPGFFLAVGQFLWELNSMLSKRITWPNSWTILRGVAWTSLDGKLWTTIPLVQSVSGSTKGGNVEPEMFWIVYRLDIIDALRATLSTDVGLYLFDIQDTMNTIKNVFNSEPDLDYSNISGNVVSLFPIGRTGPYAAQCTARDATGTCITCLGTAKPVTIPQIVGEGGSVQPNFDCCIERPQGPGAIDTTAYSSVEAAVDGFAIAAYAGYDQAKPMSNYVSGLKQSFLQQGSDGLNTIIICPRYTNVDSTPSAINGPQYQLANKLQCTLQTTFTDATSAVQNTEGGVIVRRPITSSGLPDASYNGGLVDSTYKYQEFYRRDSREPAPRYESVSARPKRLSANNPRTKTRRVKSKHHRFGQTAFLGAKYNRR
jgi:hypothetical protein